MEQQQMQWSVPFPIPVVKMLVIRTIMKDKQLKIKLLLKIV